MRRIAFVLALLAFGAAVAAGQIPNPTTVAWDHVDWASASRYDGAYHQLLVKADNTCDLASTPGAVATAIDNLGKPTTTTGVGMAAPLGAKPIGCYVYRVPGP